MPNQITTTITKSISQAGLPFVNSSFPLTGEVAPYVETQVTVGTPQTINISIDTNVNLIYALSDSLDVTIAFYTGANGTGTLLNTITCQAGIAQEWDSGLNASSSPTYHSGALTACLSIVLTATNYIDTIASGGTPTSSAVHMRTSMTS